MNQLVPFALFVFVGGLTYSCLLAAEWKVRALRFKQERDRLQAEVDSARLKCERLARAVESWGRVRWKQRAEQLELLARKWSLAHSHEAARRLAAERQLHEVRRQASHLAIHSISKN